MTKLHPALLQKSITWVLELALMAYSLAEILLVILSEVKMTKETKSNTKCILKKFQQSNIAASAIECTKWKCLKFLNAPPIKQIHGSGYDNSQNTWRLENRQNPGNLKQKMVIIFLFNETIAIYIICIFIHYLNIKGRYVFQTSHFNLKTTTFIFCLCLFELQ